MSLIYQDANGHLCFQPVELDGAWWCIRFLHHNNRDGKMHVRLRKCQVERTIDHPVPARIRKMKGLPDQITVGLRELHGKLARQWFTLLRTSANGAEKKWVKPHSDAAWTAEAEHEALPPEAEKVLPKLLFRYTTDDGKKQIGMAPYCVDEKNGRCLVVLIKPFKDGTNNVWFSEEELVLATQETLTGAEAIDIFNKFRRAVHKDPRISKHDAMFYDPLRVARMARRKAMPKPALTRTGKTAAKTEDVT